jgi:hypothetical protein
MELLRIIKLLQEVEKPIEKIIKKSKSNKVIKRKDLKLPKSSKIGQETQKEYIKTLAKIDKKIMKMPKKKLKKIVKEEIENITESQGGCYSCGAGQGEMHHKKCRCEECICGGQVLGSEAINMGTFKYGGKYEQLQHPFNEIPYEQIPYPYKRESEHFKYWYYL